MSIFEDALADAKKINELATLDATNTIISSIIPRLREFVEKSLINNLEDEQVDQDEIIDVEPLIDPLTQQELLNDDSQLPIEPGNCVVTTTISVPSVDDQSITDATGEVIDDSVLLSTFNENLQSLEKSVSLFEQSSNILRKTTAFSDKISEMIVRVEDMYKNVQENFVPDQKIVYENRLEKMFSTLNKFEIQEQKTVKKIRENDEQLDVDSDVEETGELTLKLSGLPAGVDLDDIGVDLVGDEDEESTEDFDTEETEDFDMSDEDEVDLDLDVDAVDDIDMEEVEESASPDDNTVLEIDESMLRSELKRLQSLKEDHPVEILKDFGGASSEGEPLDVELTTADNEKTATAAVEMKISCEKKVQEHAKARAMQIKEAARKVSPTRRAQLKVEHDLFVKVYNESVIKTQKMLKVLKETKSNYSNSKSKQMETAYKNVQTKLSEVNRRNAQLTQELSKLKESKNQTKAKPVNENLLKSQGSNSGPSAGGVSRVTRPSSTQINEGVGIEVSRWSTLAGIK